MLDRLHFGDIRDFPPDLLDGVDAVVHLAAISNDPMGKEFEAVTEAINEKASIALAQMAQERGVGTFVFASSCSIYGAAEGSPRRESDPLNPLTAYARSKVAMENALRSSNAGRMTVTCLRFATACGMSDRLRLDLVLNDFVASALATGEITVLSDGTPWRPLIDVADMARAIEWAIGRSAEHGGRFLVVNAGNQAGNYQVRELAEVVSTELPGTKVSINRRSPPRQTFLPGRLLAVRQAGARAFAGGIARQIGAEPCCRPARHGIFGRRIPRLTLDAPSNAQASHCARSALPRPALAVILRNHHEIPCRAASGRLHHRTGKAR